MEDKRRDILQKIAQRAEIMVQGSFSQTFRTCKTPNCRCQRGEKHGPHTYLTFRTPQGRSTSLYVPQAQIPDFRQAVEAWNEFWDLAKELAHENRQRLAQRRPGRPRRSADARKA